jgi:reactive chlorine resistance protein C
MAADTDPDHQSNNGMPAASTGAPLATLLLVAQHLMDRLFAAIECIWAPFLRTSLAIVLIWLGADKFANPTYTVALMGASPLYGFLAITGSSYALGVLEIVAAGFLLTNRAVRYVGLLVVLLFAGTFSIFLTTPAITFASPQGFPVLSHTGEFLLKDLVLAAAAIAAVAHDVRQHRALAEPAPHSS